MDITFVENGKAKKISLTLISVQTLKMSCDKRKGDECLVWQSKPLLVWKSYATLPSASWALISKQP